MSDFLDLEKSKMISSAIFLALPYGLIGNCTERFSEILQGKKFSQSLHGMKCPTSSERIGCRDDN
jgi:hypothetical protein